MPKKCNPCDYLVSDETKVYQQDQPTLTTVEIKHCPVCGSELRDA